MYIYIYMYYISRVFLEYVCLDQSEEVLQLQLRKLDWGLK